jgi:hypothetical protein
VGQRSWRVEVEVKEAPPIRPLPPRYRVHVRKARLLTLLLKEAIHYRFNRKVVLSRPCIYGVFSGRLGGFRPQHAKCVACMRCKQEYPSVIKDIVPNPEFLALGDSYLTPEAIWTINREATTGGDITRGMGYKGPFSGPGFDSIWTDMSEIVRPTRHGKLDVEYISTRVDIGRPFVHLDAELLVAQEPRLLTSNLPIILDWLPPQMTSPHISLTLAKAAASAGTYAVIPRAHCAEGVVPQDHSSSVWAYVESQGEAQAPIRAAAIEVAPQALEAIPTLRRSFQGLVVQRLPFSPGFEEAMLRALELGADALHLCADYHGRGYGGLENAFITELLRRAHLRLLDERLRDGTTLIVSGGIIRAEHAIKAILLGADLVAIDMAALAALQLYPEGEARLPSRTRIKLSDFPLEWGVQRVANLLNSWREQMIEIMSAMGTRDVRRLRGEVGRAMFNEVEEDMLRRYVAGELDAQGVAP